MALLSLPVEILEVIFLYVLDNGDYESMALSCRACYAVSKSQQRCYNALRKQWRNTKCDHHQPRGPQSVLEVLLVIAESPVVAHLVRTLDLQHATETRPRNSETECRKKPTDGEIASVRRMISSSRRLVAASQDVEEWAEHIISTAAPSSAQAAGQSTYATAYLLSILPKLRRLTLPRSWKSAEMPKAWEQVLFAPVETVHPGELPLASLEELLPWQEIEYFGAVKGMFSELEQFLLLPRLKKVHVTNIMDKRDGWVDTPFEWLSPASSLDRLSMSNVRTLILEACSIDAAGISTLLERMPAITSLRYSHHVKMSCFPRNWDAGAFITAVAQRAGSTLRRLSVTIHDWVSNTDSGIVTLRGFAALEELQLDVRMFAASWCEKDIGVNSRACLGAYAACLTEILPSKIKAVSLVLDHDQIAQHDAARAAFEQQLLILRTLFRDGSGVREALPRLNTLLLRFNSRIQEPGDMDAIRYGGTKAEGETSKYSRSLLSQDKQPKSTNPVEETPAQQVGRLLRDAEVRFVEFADYDEVLRSMPWEYQHLLCSS